ncbi:MAG: LTA synthase family protein [Bacteroidales bacterium]|nr:LTA synthase family protein [Bacteroidales bacterium]
MNYRRLLRHDGSVLLLRLLLLYPILFLCRIVFYLYNQTLLGGLHWQEIPGLIQGSLLFDTVSILYLNVLFIILSLLPFRFRNRNGYQKMLQWIYLITNSIGLIILNLADAMYFRYAFKRITPEELHFFQQDDNTSDILLHEIGTYWYIPLIVAALIVLLTFVYKKIQIRRVDEITARPRIYYPVHTLLLLLSFVLFTFGIRGTFNFENRPVTLSNAALYTQDAQKASLILSNPFCIIRLSGVKEMEVLHYFDDATAAQYFSPYHYPKGDSGFTIGKKNIVIIVLEGFSKEHSKYLSPNLYPNQAGFTPFLDSLMRQGYVFRNAFANGTRSVEALPAIWASIPSYGTPFAEMPQCVNNLDALPRLLANEGYSTHFFMGAHANQMGFEAFAKLAGVQHFHNRTDFEAHDKRKGMANTWGIWDMPFLQFMAQELNRIDTPFCATVFTLTSHHPFVLPKEYEGKMPTGTTPMQPCVAYTDLSIRKFFATASKMPWFKNTLFVFVADHVSPKIAFEETHSAKGHTAIQYFLYTPDGSLRGESYDVTQQLDIMPTVLGLLNYQKPYFAFGRDVFHETERRHVATSYIHEMYQCITDSMSVYTNGQQCLHVYDVTDIMQYSDIRNPNNKQQQEVENYLKALLQCYTQHVHDNDFHVPAPQKSH